MLKVLAWRTAGERDARGSEPCVEGPLVLAWVWFGISLFGSDASSGLALALLTILILLNVATQILVLRAEKYHADAQ